MKQKNLLSQNAPDPVEKNAVVKVNLGKLFIVLFAVMLVQNTATAQITLLQDYQNNTSAPIGTYQGINFREAGFSALYAIPNTNGKEYWTVSDRGPNIDAANANPAACRPTYDKIFPFPGYAPKIHRIRINGDSVQILQTITMKRPNGTNATGLINPTGFGSTAIEVPSTDTVLDCANFNAKTAAKDIWGIDSEGIVVDKDGNFWICEEGGPTIWKLNPNGVVLKRYSPYANLADAQPQDAAIDTAFKYRKNNRGFEGIAIAPNGKIYAFIQSPLLYPDKNTGEATRIHRILEINPATNAMRMLAYVNDGAVGGSGQVRFQDWKLGDAAAINDSTFLVLEAAARGTTDLKRMYLINIGQATAVNSGLYGNKTLEGLIDEPTLLANGIRPVTKTLFMDLLANGWPSALDKAEGLAIINDSTIAIANDNDFGVASVPQNGIATATGNKSHVLVYRLQGSNKLVNYRSLQLITGATAPSSTQSPYLVPVAPGVSFTSILTARDSINGYKMAGTPDGLGAFDNGNGTFTVLMNHEFAATAGAVRAHGSKGAFVSKWVINKSDLSVVSGADLMQSLRLWNPATSSYYTGTTAFGRFCSADLPPVASFYNSATGLGTQERIFMNGEESGAEGRAMGHIVTGSNAGISYELPYLGKFSWENSVASPTMSNKTVVAGMDDATVGGQVYFYIGTKTNTGTEIEKAGLSGGKLFGVKVTGYIAESSATLPATGTRFGLYDLGQVQNMTGANLDAAAMAAGVTNFLRPEDGSWDPVNKRDFYFATTNAFNSPSRLWRLRFDNPSNPETGGIIEAVLDGTEGQQMFDNITVDNYGHVILVEDVGNNAHNGKVWQYTIATDQLVQLGKHDVARFGDIGVPATTPFNVDEEASGILDVQSILGAGWFLTVDQAHYTTGIPSDIVEGGQFLAMFNPDTKNAADSVGTTSITSSQTPYLKPVAPGVTFTSIISANDSIGGYKMAGTPDGLGAFDNGNGTFTVLMNHEFTPTVGAVRAHGSKGAFVSKWIINKTNLSVVSGSDLMQSVRLWNTSTSTYSTGTIAFNRFCSGDLPVVSAFYNSNTGLGTQERIYMNGEESGAEGKAMGHIVTGPNAGISYELPYLGKFSWENSVASPTMSNKTVVAGMDDATIGGQVYFYVGTKTNTGTEIDKAGLGNGKLFGVKVTGLISETSGSVPAVGTRFGLYDLGQVQNMTGAALDAASMAAGVTNFLRPEDGSWDPVNKRDFYFATTNSFNSPSRLWRLRFDDPLNPEAGGIIEAVLDGTEGQQMFDNITVDNYGHVILVEDVGNNAHNGKVWQYTIATDVLKQLGKHDVARFGDIGVPATTPFNVDEEASGTIDVQSILGAGWFLMVDQAHYSTGIPFDIVEGGQFLAMFNPDTYNSSLITPCGAPTDRLYVDATLATSGNGSTWECGLKELREAVQIANANPAIKSIWVADGTYYATTTRGIDDHIDISRADLKILGGFSGNETSASQANPTLYPTIISGDIGTPNVTADNSTVIMLIHNVPTNASRLVIDGFIFEKANANQSPRDYGGAFNAYYNTAQTPVQIKRCIFRNNVSTNAGGAITMDHSPIEFDSCRFLNNTSPNGGAVFSFQTSPTFSNCLFVQNSSINGGAYYGNYGLISFYKTIFSANTATFGGGVYQNSLDVNYINSLFSKNTASQQGGGIFESIASNLLIQNTTLYANTAVTAGGGIASGNPGTNTVTSFNSIFYKNTRGGSDNIVLADVGNANVAPNTYANTLLQANSEVPADNGAKIRNNLRGLNPQFTNELNPIGVDGIWFTADDGLQISNLSPVKDKGGNTLAPGGTDIINNPRIACTTVDMGAYEQPVCADPFRTAPVVTNAIAGAVANPFDNDLQVRYSGEEKASLKVTAVSGKVMAVSATAAKGVTHVNATTWTSGIYIVEIITSSGKKIDFKVVKL